jgi:flagellar hook-associated protein 2
VVVETDSDKIAGAVKEFVKSYNDVEKLIAELTKYDPNSKTAAVLNGESVMRQVQSQIRAVARGSMSVASGEFSRLSEVGITLSADGSLKLDETKLADLAAADPARLARLFTTTSDVESAQGFAVRLRARVKAIIEPAGTLESRQEGLRASIKTLDQQQERMQARLVLIEDRLRRQYSQLDALMTTSQSRSSALASALAGLPSTQA